MTPVDGWLSFLIQMGILLALVGLFLWFLWLSERDFQEWLDRMYPGSREDREDGTDGR